MNNIGFSGKKAGIIIAVTVCVVIGVFFLIRYLNDTSYKEDDQVVYVTDVATLTGQSISDGIVNRYGGIVESQETWSCTANSDYTIQAVLVEVFGPLLYRSTFSYKNRNGLNWYFRNLSCF